MLTRSKIISIVSSLALLFFTAVTLQAQDAPQHAMVRTTVVKPGTNAKFEEFILKIKEAAEKTDAPYRWVTSVAFAGGDESYNTVLLFNSWTMFDGQQDLLEAAYSKREVTRILKLLEDSVVTTHSTVYTLHTELSRMPPADQEELGVILAELTLNSGMNEQFADFMGKLKVATDATAPNAYWETWTPDFGGSGPLIVIPVKNWSQLDVQEKPLPQRFAEHFGEQEGRQIMETLPKMLSNASFTLHVNRPDLARPPE